MFDADTKNARKNALPHLTGKNKRLYNNLNTHLLGDDVWQSDGLR